MSLGYHQWVKHFNFVCVGKDMRLGALLPLTDGYDRVELAQRLEEWGYESVWVSELWGVDALVILGAIASQTDKIGLGTAITNVFSRSPAVLAMAAATLNDRSEGRMTLGLGTSTPHAVENIHGMAFERPVRRAHETIEVIHRLLGEPDTQTPYEGDLLSVGNVPTLDSTVPIYYAALGNMNKRVVGRLCDGWIPHMIPLSDLDEAFETVADAAREADRDPNEITVMPYVPIAASNDESEAYEALSGHIAYYVGSGDSYQRMVAERFPEKTEQISAAWHDGDRSTALAAVTDEMVDVIGVAGTPETVCDQLSERIDDTIVDQPLLAVPNQAANELADQTFESLAPE